MASLIDLHTHTTYSSICSQMTAEELIEAAIDAGLDGVAVTEHGTIEGAEVAQDLAHNKYGFPVFCGVEVRSTVFGDVLVFGCRRSFAPHVSWMALRQIVTAAGGVLIPAHPFRRWDRAALWHHLEERNIPVDAGLSGRDIFQGLTAVEVINGGCRPEENAQAAELARILELPGIGGSDAHHASRVGQVATRFPGEIQTDVELLSALKDGGYQAVDRRGRRRRIR